MRLQTANPSGLSIRLAKAAGSRAVDMSTECAMVIVGENDVSDVTLLLFPEK